MALRLEAALGGDLTRLLEAELRSGRSAARAGVKETTEFLKSRLRDQVTGAGMGRRLANTWRARVFPGGAVKTLSPAGFVWTKAPRIVQAFDEGVVVKSKAGFFLAIPTENAPRRLARRRPTPALFEQVKGIPLRLVFRRTGPSLLVADMRASQGRRGGFRKASASALRTGRGLVSAPIFILVPQVRLPKRLNVRAATRQAEDRLAASIVKHWREPR